MITLIYIPIPAVPGTLITFTLFILSLYSMNNETRGFALMCFAAPVLGALFFVLHIPLTAYFICLFLGLVFLRNYIKSSLNINEEFIYFGLLVIIFLIAYLYHFDWILFYYILESLLPITKTTIFSTCSVFMPDKFTVYIYCF